MIVLKMIDFKTDPLYSINCNQKVYQFGTKTGHKQQHKH